MTDIDRYRALHADELPPSPIGLDFRRALIVGAALVADAIAYALVAAGVIL